MNMKDHIRVSVLTPRGNPTHLLEEKIFEVTLPPSIKDMGPDGPVMTWVKEVQKEYGCDDTNSSVAISSLSTKMPAFPRMEKPKPK